jgi:hypothetical protein
MAPAALGYSSFLGDWSSAHPTSSSDDANCQLCHGQTTSQWNAYGQAVKVEFNANGGDMAAAIATVDKMDSDSDPTRASNLKEAKANTQPGWTYGPNNTVYNSSGTPTTGVLPPASVGGLLLDPVTLVTISDDAFTPAATKVKLAGTVEWVRAVGSVNSHNVAEVGGIFRSGDPTADPIFYDRTFSAGTFRYECEIHAGMAGAVKVKPRTSAKPRGTPFTLTWATAKTDTGTRFAVQYRVGKSAWRTWKKSTTAFKAVFGASGKPVTVKAGTIYGFRVRSGEGTTWSRWSPIVTFKA